MLGTLEMDVDSCIRAYKDMSPRIFPMESLVAPKATRLVNALTGTPRFDPTPLENAVKRLVRDQLREKVLVPAEGTRTDVDARKPGRLAPHAAQEPGVKKRSALSRLGEKWGATGGTKREVSPDGLKTSEEEQLENTMLKFNASRDYSRPRCKV